MAASNTKTTKSHVFAEERLAGGYGPRAAKQPAEAALRRLVLACLLWEDNAYVDGKTIAGQIAELIPQVEPAAVAAIAVEAREQQKLRHVPLFVCREMAKHQTHSGLVAATLREVIRRPDELAEYVSLYWKDNIVDGQHKKSLSKQSKRGLAAAFTKFSEYQLAKWDKSGKTVSLRDVLFLCHAKPKDAAQAELWKRLIAGTLATPDTWEVGLSAAKTAEEKAAVWARLIEDGKLGAFAFLKNLRNMQGAKLSEDIIINGLNELKPDVLLPIDFLKAVKYAPKYLRELEQAMLRCAAQFPKLPGKTIFVVDVSGSMGQRLAAQSEFNRLDAGAAMCVLAAEMCERIAVYATAGNDDARVHQTRRIPPYRGFALSDAVLGAARTLGGGGIFTRQCLEHIQTEEPEADRIIVFSDSQDCDAPGKKTPKPFGTRNYIVDVSAHKNGVNYQGAWTAEVSGWSGAFLQFIANCERSDSLQ